MAFGYTFGLGFNNIGNALDIDTLNFLQTASISNETQITAITTLVEALKSNGLWEKLDVIYPFVGGTAVSHSYNLKDVTQYQISWHGTVTHDSNGITGDGSTGYGNTNYIVPSPQTDVHLSIYIRNNIISQTTSQLFGSYKADITDSLIGYRIITPPLESTFFLGNTPSSYLETSSQNFYSIDRNNNTLRGLKNGNSFSVNTSADNQDNLLSIYLLGSNFNNSSLLEPGAFNEAFFTAGKSLTLSEHEALYNVIQAYQTSLSREI